jgi:pyruvate dehydrogenase complex dehydrogenase (E1) component
VLRANKESSELGGHIASFQSAATLYDVGQTHFWHAANPEQAGDLVYFQGHSSPGLYARAFVEGRLSEEQLLNFRQDVDGRGLSSYPHPWLMPEFWQFPTVSMGLGPLMAIYQARFLKYLDCRGLAGRDEGMTKLLFDHGTDRVIGAAIVGPSAGDLISEVALAIELGADAADIALTIHPHPTLAETVCMAAEVFEGTITDLYLPKTE